jgi:hypothetical protein
MAIIKPNNNTISAITALPAAIPVGKVLQVVRTSTTTAFSTSSTSFQSTNCSATITPSSTSSKIVGFAQGMMYQSNTNHESQYVIFRDATNLNGEVWSFGEGNNTGSIFSPMTFSFHDAPSSTSTLQYILKLKTSDVNNSVNFYRQQFMTLMEIAG